LEVLEGGQLALNEGFDTLSGLTCGSLEAVEVPAEHRGLDGAESVVLDELEAADRGEVVAIEAGLNKNRERLCVGLAVGAPVVREADLEFLHQRGLLELEQDPVLVSQSPVEVRDHETILVGPLVAGPVNLAVGGHGAPSVVLGENEMLVRKLAENQHRWLVEGRLIAVLAEPERCQGLATPLRKGTLVHAAFLIRRVEDVEDVGALWLVCFRLGRQGGDLLLVLTPRVLEWRRGVSVLPLLRLADDIEEELEAAELEDEVVGDGVGVEPVADEPREVVVAASTQAHEGVYAGSPVFGRLSEPAVELLDDSHERAEGHLGRDLVFVLAPKSQEVRLNHVCDLLDLRRGWSLGLLVAEAARGQLFAGSPSVEEEPGDEVVEGCLELLLQLLARGHLLLELGDGQSVALLQPDVEGHEKEVVGEAEPHHHRLLRAGRTFKAAKIQMAPQELGGLAEEGRHFRGIHSGMHLLAAAVCLKGP